MPEQSQDFHVVLEPESIVQHGGQLARSTCSCCRNIFVDDGNAIGVNCSSVFIQPRRDANDITEPGSDDALDHFQLVLLLDGAVRKANSIKFLGRRYHPYHLASDLSTVAIILFSGWYTTRLPHLPFLGFVTAFTTMLCLYWGVRQLRFRWLGISARSYVQDTITVLLPTYALTSLAVGNSLTQSMDLIALDLALGIAFIRVGCFLGGCCYGRPASWVSNIRLIAWCRSMDGVAFAADQYHPTACCRYSFSKRHLI